MKAKDNEILFIYIIYIKRKLKISDLSKKLLAAINKGIHLLLGSPALLSCNLALLRRGPFL
jgi:hypothetical protein